MLVLGVPAPLRRRHRRPRRRPGPGTRPVRSRRRAAHAGPPRRAGRRHVGGVRVLRARTELPWLPDDDLVARVASANHHLVQLSTRLDGWVPDIVHAHDWQVAWAADTLATLYGAQLVATFHATERGRHGGRVPPGEPSTIHAVESWLAHDAADVVASSKFMVSEVVGGFELPAERTHLIPNGIDPTWWSTGEAAGAGRRSCSRGAGCSTRRASRCSPGRCACCGPGCPASSASSAAAAATCPSCSRRSTSRGSATSSTCPASCPTTGCATPSTGPGASPSRRSTSRSGSSPSRRWPAARRSSSPAPAASPSSSTAPAPGCCSSRATPTSWRPASRWCSPTTPSPTTCASGAGAARRPLLLGRHRRRHRRRVRRPPVAP